MSVPFGHEFRVRYRECDPQGIVFNAEYVAYFDDVFTELLRDTFGSYGALTERGIDMVAGELNVAFRESARFDDMLRVEVRIEEMGTTSMTTRFDILREGVLIAEGRVRHVFLDKETWKKTPIPDWAREALSPYLVEGERAKTR